MRKIIIFFFTLSLVTSGILLAAADFGESSASLGQFTDEFINLDSVSVRSLIERNATLNAMELNFTALIPFENFTTYTETDPDNKITVFDFNITVAEYERNDAGRVVFDYGVGSISDGWEYEFEINVTALDAGDASTRNIGTWITLQQSDQAGLSLNEIGFQFRQRGADDTVWGSQWIIFDGGVATSNQLGVVDYNVSQEYYVRMNRTGNTKILAVYFDSARLNLVEALTINVGADDYRYICIQRVILNPNDGNDDYFGYVRDLHNTSIPGIGYQTEGYFSTTDYLTGINGAVLVQLTNATIPAGTGITAEFSPDNSTWENPTALTAGFMSIDLRDQNWSTAHHVRYNFTGTGAETPRLYQSRLITTEGAAVAGPGPSVNVSGIWIDYRASAINFTVGTHGGGDLNSTFDIDGNTWNHTEVVGVPGSVISVNFTGVDPDSECIWVTIWYLYDGNLQHDFDIEMWNFTSSSWVDDGHLIDGVAFVWANSTIYAMRIPLSFLENGEVRVQLNHESPGNINHDLFIDYIRLVAKTPGDPLIVEGGAVAIFPWIAIAIILSLITYLLARER